MTPADPTTLVQRFLSRYRRALLARVGILLMLSLAIAAASAWRISRLDVPSVWRLMVPGVLTGVALSVLAWRLRRRWGSASQGALWLDQTLRLQQRLVTAVEFAAAAQPPPLYPQLLDDTVQRCALRQPGLPRPADRAAAVLLVVLLLLLLWPGAGGGLPAPASGRQAGLMQLAQRPSPAAPIPPSPPEAPPDAPSPPPPRESQPSRASQPSQSGQSGDARSTSLRAASRAESRDAERPRGGPSRDGRSSPREASQPGDGTGQDAGATQGAEQDQPASRQQGASDQASAREGAQQGVAQSSGVMSQQAAAAQQQGAQRGQSGMHAQAGGLQSAAARQRAIGQGAGQALGGLPAPPVGGAQAGSDAMKAQIQQLLREVSSELKALQAQLEQAAKDHASAPQAGTGTDPSLFESPSPLPPAGTGAAVPMGLATDTADTRARRPGGGTGEPSARAEDAAPQATPEPAQLADEPREEPAAEREAVPPEYQDVFGRLKR